MSIDDCVMLFSATSLSHPEGLEQAVVKRLSLHYELFRIPE